MPGANEQLASLFQEMSDLLQVLEGDKFRVAAFARAARALADSTQDVAAIGPDAKALTAIDGIGPGTAGRIVEFLTTGKIKDHDELLAQVPPGLLALLKIQGLGPKTVTLLWKQAGVTDLATLKAKLADDALADLPGMGAKKIANLRQSLSFAETSGQRVRIGQAMPLALWFVESLRKLPAVREVAYAGSLRRGKETIGDVDLLVAASESDAAKISDAFIKMEPVTRVLAHGKTKSSVQIGGVDNSPGNSEDEQGSLPGAGGVQVDLRVVEPASYGAALLYFTGSKEHNVSLRERAIKMGLKLNEYGLYKGEKLVAGKTEQDVYKALGLVWIPPELREDRDEIALAEKGTLPNLIKVEDIHAELHAHTRASDGVWTIRELIEHAIARSFHTLAITDHSKSQVIANGLSEKRLEEHIAAVREAAAEYKNKITVLAGSEVDILSDGSLDYQAALLKELDVVVASPHAALTQDPAKATKRLLKAIANRYVTVLGHPTGRLVGPRPGLSPDMKQLIAAAAERGIAMEINANSYRLDLRDAHARAAVEAGVKLAINTDAHGPGDLDQLVYGVLTARRAGAGAADVVNCMTREGLAKWIKATRA